MVRVRRLARALLALGLGLSAERAWAAPVVLETTVSHEHPDFRPALSRMAIGRDGLVYLFDGDIVVRLDRRGRGKRTQKVTYALTAVAANAAGVMATANAHFNHRVELWSPAFDRLGKVDDFLVSDQADWSAPDDVQAGPSGDFYGLDENRQRVVRVQAPGKESATYSLAGLGEDLIRSRSALRVWEAGRRFYVLCQSGALRVIDFEGRLLWTVDSRILRDNGDGWRGAFDVDGAGQLMILGDHDDVVRLWSGDGKPLKGLALQMGARKGRVADLRVFGDEVLVKRPHGTELFQVYDRRTGALLRVVSGDATTFRFELGSDVWTAGAPVTLRALETPGASATRVSPPTWRVWLRGLGAARFEELPWAGGTVTPPVGAGGLYDLRIAPSVDGSGGPYAFDQVIEIRQPNAVGTLSVWTPNNRTDYGRGEAIPVQVEARLEARRDLSQVLVTVNLVQNGLRLAAHSTRLDAGGRASLAIPAELTASLAPGDYRLEAALAATGDVLTLAPQPVRIGVGLAGRNDRLAVTQYGDYSASFPPSSPFDGVEALTAHLARARALGITRFADRMQPSMFGVTRPIAGLAERLTAERGATAPEKAVVDGPPERVLAAYGASGIEAQGILLGMDAGLPIGTGYDRRSVDEDTQAIARMAKALAPFPAFRGFSWAANWWVMKLGAESADGPDEKDAYTKALKAANDTGVWDPVLDRVSDRMLAYAVDAEKAFATALKKVAPGAVSSMTGPYRAVGVLPPVTFRNADEVDLHYQAEQLQPPGVAPHNVDFDKRPGKKAWGHPELWNDDGTGGMILPTLLAMTMRGADGVGFSGDPAPWGSGRSDPRSGGAGGLSVFRALDGLLADYGSWLTTLAPHDQVAIVVSSRMMRIDTWGKVGGVYFDHLFEAYGACLRAHHPASFVFTEDLTPEAFSPYRAALVVGQRVALDPPMVAALDRARAAGLSVFADGTSRPELVRAYTPLGIDFDRVTKDPSAMQDDGAHARIPAYLRDDALTLRRVFDPLMPPVAEVDDPDVLLTERTSGRGRFVWVLNDHGMGLEPGLMWRMGLNVTSRLPQVVDVGLRTQDEAVYDVFARRRVPRDPAHPGTVRADLRDLPARLFAVLPHPIASVRLDAPTAVRSGVPFAFCVAVLDDGGAPVEASVPVRVTLSWSGERGDSRAVSLAPLGSRACGTQVPPVGASGDGFVLRATEQFGGQEVEKRIRLERAAMPVDLVHPDFAHVRALPATSAAPVDPGDRRAEDPPAVDRFGPHVKDLAVSAREGVVLASLMNWGENVEALDLESGAVRWKHRVGHHFAYAPLATEAGLAVEGFDVGTAEGYHLYLLDPAGQPSRRFALYGLPKRATSWAIGSQMQDPLGDGTFAVSPAGDWVACGGDLGLAVWSAGADGHPLWQVDGWPRSRTRVQVLAVGADELVALRGTEATGYGARKGEPRWAFSIENALTKETTFDGGVVASDGTVALRTSGDGGRVFVLRRGKSVGVIPAVADDLAIAPDGRMVVVTQGTSLKAFADDGGLLWTFQGDDRLRRPRISRDGRIVVGSDLGTLTVLSLQGHPLWQEDFKALPVATFLPDGDMVVGTWMGVVERRDLLYDLRWRTQLAEADRGAEAPSVLFAPEALPTSRVVRWGNAAATPAPLSPNLLAQTHATINPNWRGLRRTEWATPIATLTDGSPEPPTTPRLPWTTVAQIDSGYATALDLEVDLQAEIELTGVTFVEDAAHPESWLRDVRLQVQDGPNDPWRDGPYLLSDAAVHTHWLPTPLRGRRFRLVSTGGGSWPAGNVRLGELVFHGRVLPEARGARIGAPITARTR